MMRTVDARYEDGMLKPERPLQLRSGERVGVIIVRRPDRSRWDLKRLAAKGSEDETLASAGLEQWADALDDEDRQ